MREKRKAEVAVLDLTVDEDEDEEDTTENVYSDDALFGCGAMKRKIEIAFSREEQKPRDVKKRIRMFSPHDSDPPRPIPWAKLRKLEMINQARLKKKMPDEVYTHVRTSCSACKTWKINSRGHESVNNEFGTSRRFGNLSACSKLLIAILGQYSMEIVTHLSDAISLNRKSWTR